MRAGGVILLVLAFFGVVTILSTYYTVNQGERAVILHNGAFEGVTGPGLHFNVPFITSVERVSVRPFLVVFGGDSGFNASSRDQQIARIRVSVNMHVADDDATVASVYNKYTSLEGARERLVDPQVYQSVRNVFGTYDAADAIQQRAKLSAEIEGVVVKAVGKDKPITINSVQIEQISFSEDYNQAVEQRMQAQVAAVKAEAQKAQKIIEADASAYQVKAAADAKAHQIEVEGEAEAKAIRARGDALRDNPQLVSLNAVQKWNGVLPTTMPPGGSVPFVNVSPPK